jgi:hypothetical protein
MHIEERPDTNCHAVQTYEFTPVQSPSSVELQELYRQRDGCRCMITGLYDKKAKDMIPKNTPESRFQNTDLIHILPPNLGLHLINADAYHSSAWLTLFSFFPGIASHYDPSPERFDDPSSVMTMTSSLHASFRQFDFALESTVCTLTRVSCTNLTFTGGDEHLSVTVLLRFRIGILSCTAFSEPGRRADY